MSWLAILEAVWGFDSDPESSQLPGRYVLHSATGCFQPPRTPSLTCRYPCGLNHPAWAIGYSYCFYFLFHWRGKNATWMSWANPQIFRFSLLFPSYPSRPFRHQQRPYTLAPPECGADRRGSPSKCGLLRSFREKTGEEWAAWGWPSQTQLLTVDSMTWSFGFVIYLVNCHGWYVSPLLPTSCLSR